MSRTSTARVNVSGGLLHVYLPDNTVRKCMRENVTRVRLKGNAHSLYTRLKKSGKQWKAPA